MVMKEAWIFLVFIQPFREGGKDLPSPSLGGIFYERFAWARSVDLLIGQLNEGWVTFVLCTDSFTCSIKLLQL
jgi:hypothetical protein